MKASVLAVGTELTCGQITNRNAAWISQKLYKMGVQTEIHMTVADDRKAIREALDLLERKSDFLFVTGGLGPTSDDFTRELVTEWAGLPLEFHEPSWQKIQDRLNSRGIPVKEFQKQQCYFPKGSKVLENSQGTANAFYLETKSKNVWVLPGPPNEIAAIWNDHVQERLQFLTRDLNPYMTVSWDNLGLGEATAPTLVEPAVQGSGAEIGYRVHMPYLEIKLSFYQSELNRMKPYIAKVDEALKDYVVTRNDEDILQMLSSLIPQDEHLFILDQVSQGLLLGRIQSVRKQNLTYTSDSSVQYHGSSWQIRCHFMNEFEYELELVSPRKKSFKKVITSPYSKAPQMSERRRQYFAELAFITAFQHWRD